MATPLVVKLPAVQLSSVKGPWLAKLIPVPGAQRSWSPASLTKQFLRWTRRTETQSIYQVTEPGIYQGLCGRPEFNPMEMNPNVPAKQQATKNGLFEVYEAKHPDTGVIQLKSRRFETTNPKTGRTSADWPRALDALFPETTGCAKDYQVGAQLDLGVPPTFDFAKDTKTAAEVADALDIPRYNRVECKECNSRGHHIEYRSVIAETPTEVKVQLKKKDGTPSKRTMTKIVQVGEVIGTFPAPGQVCGACKGKGFYLVSIDTIDPLKFALTTHKGSAVHEFDPNELLTKTVYWVDYGSGAPRRRQVEHWPTPDPLSSERTFPIESWNEKIEDVVGAIEMDVDYPKLPLEEAHDLALWFNETWKSATLAG